MIVLNSLCACPNSASTWGGYWPLSEAPGPFEISGWSLLAEETFAAKGTDSSNRAL